MVRSCGTNEKQKRQLSHMGKGLLPNPNAMRAGVQTKGEDKVGPLRYIPKRLRTKYENLFWESDEFFGDVLSSVVRSVWERSAGCRFDLRTSSSMMTFAFSTFFWRYGEPA